MAVGQPAWCAIAQYVVVGGRGGQRRGGRRSRTHDRPAYALLRLFVSAADPAHDGSSRRIVRPLVRESSRVNVRDAPFATFVNHHVRRENHVGFGRQVGLLMRFGDRIDDRAEAVVRGCRAARSSRGAWRAGWRRCGSGRGRADARRPPIRSWRNPRRSSPSSASRLASATAGSRRSAYRRRLRRGGQNVASGLSRARRARIQHGGPDGAAVHR